MKLETFVQHSYLYSMFGVVSESYQASLYESSSEWVLINSRYRSGCVDAGININC